MNFSSIEHLRSAGFTGFSTVEEMQTSGGRAVPDEAGVYMIVRSNDSAATFELVSRGGHFKGRNPTVDPSILQDNWVPDSPVLYIGKAGGGSSAATLRKRLRSYMQFGAGKPIGHWGGRFVWQLADSSKLLVCWSVPPSEDSIEMETRLIRAFSDQYGKRPFANLRD